MSVVHMAAEVLSGPDGSGVGGSLIITVALGLPAYVRSARKSAARHAQQLAQAAGHHKAEMEQRERHHREMKDQAAKHSQEQLDRQEVAATAITAGLKRGMEAGKSPVNLEFTGGGTPLADAVKRNARKAPGGGM